MGAWASEDLASVSTPILEAMLRLQGTKLQSCWTFASMSLSARYEADTGETIATLAVVWLDLYLKLLR